MFSFLLLFTLVKLSIVNDQHSGKEFFNDMCVQNIISDDIRNILHEILLQEKVELAANEVFTLLSYGVDTYCEFKMDVADIILQYFLNNERSLEKLFFIYLQTFSREYLSEIREVDVEMCDLLGYLEDKSIVLIQLAPFSKY